MAVADEDMPLEADSIEVNAVNWSTVQTEGAAGAISVDAETMPVGSASAAVLLLLTLLGLLTCGITQALPAITDTAGTVLGGTGDVI